MLKIIPGFAQGEMRPPASKSILHRAIIAASLAQGESKISHISLSQDIEATISSMKALGASISQDDNNLLIDGSSTFKTKVQPLNCYESGSTLRFLLPLATFSQQKVIFNASKSLLSRPLTIYEEIFAANDIDYVKKEESIVIKGSLKNNYYKLRGDISSQFISGLLFSLPLLKHDSTIEIIEPFQSESYVDLTLSVLDDFGIKTQRKGNFIFVEGNQSYQVCNFKVESDYSQAAFFMALGAINGKVRIKGLNVESKQGDRLLLDILNLSNAKINCDSQLTIETSDLQIPDINLEDIPDLGPILMVLALFNNKESCTLYNTKRLAFKESNRALTMQTELKKVGARIEVFENEIKVYSGFESISSVVFNGHNDHRVVMALTILATRLDFPSYITGTQAINKSYPNFFEDLKALGIKIIE